MYIKSLDCCPLWAWNINYEDLTIEDLNKIELRFGEEVDLLCDPNFMYSDFF